MKAHYCLYCNLMQIRNPTTLQFALVVLRLLQRLERLGRRHLGLAVGHIRLRHDLLGRLRFDIVAFETVPDGNCVFELGRFLLLARFVSGLFRLLSARRVSTRCT